jgi:hypothetical protein
MLKFKELNAEHFNNEEFTAKKVLNSPELFVEMLKLLHETQLGINNHELLVKNLTKISQLNDFIIQCEQQRILL